MNIIQADKKKMPFFDTLKTAAAVGLLMQQVSVMPYNEGKSINALTFSAQLNAGTNNQIANLMMDEALEFIIQFTDAINRAYTLLLESEEAERASVIRALDPEKTDLAELQLRGLEGAIKQVFNRSPEKVKETLKPALLVTVKARAASAKLNDLISQMTKPVKEFRSDIDIDALRALARHGSEVFNSGKFH